MKYEINGNNLPSLSCYLETGEFIDCQAGAMVCHDESIVMDTKFSGIGKAFGRMFSNESMFRNRYSATRPGKILFSSSFPGAIVPIELTNGRSVVLQKHSYLASFGDINDSIHFQKKISSGLFGGEGFIMQRFEGNGVVFAEVDGSVSKHSLASGQSIYISTGHLAMMDSSCSMDIIVVKGVKNIFLGGEGMFLTKVTGPGNVYVQSMPINKTAMLLYRYIPHKSS